LLRKGGFKKNRWHYLKGITERYVVLEGVGSVEVGNLESQEVSVGDVITIPPEERLRISNIGENDWIFLGICLPRFEDSSYVSME